MKQLYLCDDDLRIGLDKFCQLYEQRQSISKRINGQKSIIQEIISQVLTEMPTEENPYKFSAGGNKFVAFYEYQAEFRIRRAK